MKATTNLVTRASGQYQDAGARLFHLGLLVLMFAAIAASGSAWADVWGAGTLNTNLLKVRGTKKVGFGTSLCELTKRTPDGELNTLSILERSKDKTWYRVDISSYPECRDSCLREEKCMKTCSADGECSAWVRAAFLNVKRSNVKNVAEGAKIESAKTVVEQKVVLQEKDHAASETEAGLCPACERTRQRVGATAQDSGGETSAGSSLVDKASGIVTDISDGVVEAFSKAKGVASLIFNAMRDRLGSSSRRCYRYVKNALLKSGLVSRYLAGESAKNAGPELVKEGFENLLRTQHTAKITSPCDAPVGSILVYDGGRHGHIEIKTEKGYVSDFFSPNPRTGSCRNGRVGRDRRLIGVYVKPGADTIAQLAAIREWFWEMILPSANAVDDNRATSPPDSPEAIDEMYQQLKAEVAKQLVANVDEKLQGVVKLTLVLLKKDPSQHAIEIFYPCYKKFKKQTDKLLQQHTASERKLFQKALRDFEREQREGNG